MGGPAAQVPGGGRADRRRQEDEEDDVGTVLELPPKVLQVPLHRVKGDLNHDSNKATRLNYNDSKNDEGLRLKGLSMIMFRGSVS